MTNIADSFWWYVTLEGGPGTEEVLASLAEMSGSIGSEESVRGDSVLLRAYYRTSQDLGFWVGRLEEALDLAGDTGRRHGQDRKQAGHTDGRPSALPVGENW